MDPAPDQKTPQPDVETSTPSPTSPETALTKPQTPAETPAGISNEDTVRIGPGDPLYEAILAAQEPPAPMERPKPKTDTMIVPGAGRMASAPLGRQPSGGDDRGATYRKWLEGKSKEDLIELVIGLGSRENPAEHTDKVPRLKLDEGMLDVASEGVVIPEDLTFVRLPVVRKNAINDPMPTWRIVLVALDMTIRPAGLQIDSEITVGRTAGDATPDFDLTPYGAKTKGVSRIHARLRPEMHSLVLVDCASSNGTFWNKIRIPANTDQLLKDGDVVTFGRVNFLIRVVKPPSTHDTKTLL